MNHDITENRIAVSEYPAGDGVMEYAVFQVNMFY